MHPLHYLALAVPPIRRLHESRNTLRRERDLLSARLAACEQALSSGRTDPSQRPPVPSPYWCYQASFDAEEVIRRHAAPQPQSLVGYVTNYLGVRIDPRVCPSLLAAQEGTVEAVPVPANWHADIAEWAAALRAVDLARGRFTILELGCGWGCWMLNTGVAARRAGLAVTLAGVEGDRGHLGLAREHLAVNGFDPSEVLLHHGIAAAETGLALMPRETAERNWGLQPVLDATEEERHQAARQGSHDAVPMLALSDVVTRHDRVDLLHIDIQGGEADLVAACLATLAERVAYLVVGTHSRAIEGRLLDVLGAAKWALEMERPAILAIDSGRPRLFVDGVQGWRNPGLSSPLP